MFYHPTSSRLRIFLLCLVFSSLVFLVPQLTCNTSTFLSSRSKVPPLYASAIIAKCRHLQIQAGPPQDFHTRTHSDRFEEGTRPVLVTNAKIWTGWKNGTEVIQGDILMDKGIIKHIGYLQGGSLVELYGKRLIILDAKGAWVTPGIVDIHSHIGIEPSPILSGTEDVNSWKGTMQPWLRSLDALNTHDDSYLLSIAGGVTTSLVLPGSADAIGGQAFVIKLRETAERSPSSMLLEPPYHVNTSFPNPELPPRWRHIKHACGENPSRVYQDTRMDTLWAFREAYHTATQIRKQQDEYCARAMTGDWVDLGDFPEVLEWESLVDVLRGKVKVHVHAYEAVDLDALVRLSNEFKFPITVFHHATEAYLVPDILKQTYGNLPAIALYSASGRYKREAYRASEFAPRILAEHGLTVLMKSDHSNSRHLLYEAQQAYYYGFPENLAIASVTSNSAEAMGMGHRIGYLKKGYDADLVIWDSHPMALGATPSQVFIDGIAQLEVPFIVSKPKAYQQTPRVPNFNNDAQKAVDYEGLPPLVPKKFPINTTIILKNVKSLYQKKGGVIDQVLSPQDTGSFSTIVICNGSIVCSGNETCPQVVSLDPASFLTIDLEGGSISPGFVSFGSPLGLQHMNHEPSTNDGIVYDPLLQPILNIPLGSSADVHAADGLEYGSRDALLAYRAGVTMGVTYPSHQAFYSGLGIAFSLGVTHKLEQGAVVQEVTGVHVSIRHRQFSKLSISTQIAALRKLLLDSQQNSAGGWFKRVTAGEIPLVVEAHSADVIATLITLKKEVEDTTKIEMRLTITGGAEAHLLAKELGAANVGVILTPSRLGPFSYVWEGRRFLAGPPITKNSSIIELITNKVVVGIGCEMIWSARNLPFDIAWAAIEAGGRISKEEAFALGSLNIEKLLGIEVQEDQTDLVATQGNDLLEFGSRVLAVISPRDSAIYLFEGTMTITNLL